MISRHQYLIAALLIVGAAATRLWLHVPNMTMVGAAALFAGAYMQDKRLALAVPFVTLFVTDAFLGGYEPWVMTGVYGSFAMIGTAGWYLRTRKTPLAIFSAAIGSSVLFYLITNFAVWAATPWYAKTFAGLLSCYALALPFFRNMLIGDVLFTAMLFSVPVAFRYGADVSVRCRALVRKTF